MLLAAAAGILLLVFTGPTRTYAADATSSVSAARGAFDDCSTKSSTQTKDDSSKSKTEVKCEGSSSTTSNGGAASFSPGDCDSKSSVKDDQSKSQTKCDGTTLAGDDCKYKEKTEVKDDSTKSKSELKCKDDDKSSVKTDDKSKSSVDTSSADNKDHKVTLCHATGSASNPYVMITIDEHAVAAHEKHQDGQDIIPAPAGGCPGGATVTTQVTNSAGAVIIPQVIVTRLQNAGFTVVDTGTSVPMSGEVVTINGLSFIAYPIGDATSTIALLRSLPANSLVWSSGSMLLTSAPDTTVPLALQNQLLPQLGPSSTPQQFADNLAAGAAPPPAATGTGGLLGTAQSPSAAAWLLVPALLLATAGARFATRRMR